MEALVSVALSLITACGVYLILRPTTFSVVLGLSLLSYAVNVLIFFGARLKATAPPLTSPGAIGSDRSFATGARVDGDRDRVWDDGLSRGAGLESQSGERQRSCRCRCER